MALFKILRGLKNKLASQNFHDGYCYFTTDDQMFYIDYIDEENKERREPLNANNTNYLSGAELTHTINDTAISSDTVPTSAAVLTAIQNGMPQIKQFYEPITKYTTSMDFSNYEENIFDSNKNYYFVFCNGLLLMEEINYQISLDKNGISFKDWSVEGYIHVIYWQKNLNLNNENNLNLTSLVLEDYPEETITYDATKSGYDGYSKVTVPGYEEILGNITTTYSGELNDLEEITNLNN